MSFFDTIGDTVEAAYNKAMGTAAASVQNAVSAGIGEVTQLQNAAASLRQSVSKMAQGRALLNSKLQGLQYKNPALYATSVELLRQGDSIARKATWILQKVDSTLAELKSYLQSKQNTLGAVVLITVATVSAVLGIVYAVKQITDSYNNNIALQLRKIDSVEKTGGNAADVDTGKNKANAAKWVAVGLGAIGVLLLLRKIK